MVTNFPISPVGSLLWLQPSRFVLFAAAIAGIVLSIITAVTCDFLTYNYDADYPPDLSVGMINTTFSTGLFLWDPSGEGCRGFPDAPLGLGQTGARIGAATAVGCAVAGMSIAWIEYICCRFCGGRFLEALCFVVAFLGQASTFLLYSNDLWYVWSGIYSGRDWLFLTLLIDPVPQIFRILTHARFPLVVSSQWELLPYTWLVRFSSAVRPNRNPRVSV